MSTNHTMKYVNVYRVGRSYGGPEEGGWWYDTGEPVASIPVELDWDTEVQPVFAALREAGEPEHKLWDLAAGIFEEALYAKCYDLIEDLKLEERFENTGASSSVLGGDDYRIIREDDFARAYPTERPRYE